MRPLFAMCIKMLVWFMFSPVESPIKKLLPRSVFVAFRNIHYVSLVFQSCIHAIMSVYYYYYFYYYYYVSLSCICSFAYRGLFIVISRLDTREIVFARWRSKDNYMNVVLDIFIILSPRLKSWVLGKDCINLNCNVDINFFLK